MYQSPGIAEAEQQSESQESDLDDLLAALESHIRGEYPNWFLAELVADNVLFVVRIEILLPSDEDARPLQWSDEMEKGYQRLRECLDSAVRAGRESMMETSDREEPPQQDCAEKLHRACSLLEVVRNTVRPDYALRDIVHGADAQGGGFAGMTRETFLCSEYNATLQKLHAWMNDFEGRMKSVDVGIIQEIVKLWEDYASEIGGLSLIHAIMREQEQDALPAIRETHGRVKALMERVAKHLADVPKAENLQLHMRLVLEHLMSAKAIIDENPSYDARDAWRKFEVIGELSQEYRNAIARNVFLPKWNRLPGRKAE